MTLTSFHVNGIKVHLHWNSSSESIFRVWLSHKEWCENNKMMMTIISRNDESPWNFSTFKAGYFNKEPQEKGNKWATTWQNLQNDLCTQRRLGSALASTQSDQSLRCPHEETLGPYLLSAQWILISRMPRLIWVFARRTCHFLNFVMQQLKSYLP